MYKVYCLTAMLFLLSGNGITGTMGEVTKGINKVITISGGPAWTSNGKSQDLFLEPDLLMSFKADSPNSRLGSGELFLGFQQIFTQKLSYQLGAAISSSSDAKLSGSVWVYGNPAFDDYFYTYKVSHTHIAVKGKLLAEMGYLAQPYLSASVGTGFNGAKNFQDVSKIFEQLPFPKFNSHTSIAFTYTLGLGLQKSIIPYWNWGIGFEFADWGKSKLNPGNNQTIGSGLKLHHIYTNQLQFSLSYII